jgi:hypothetical protein
VNNQVMAKDVIHISEKEAVATNVATLLARVRAGAKSSSKMTLGPWLCFGLRSRIRAVCSRNPSFWQKPTAIP